VPRRLAALTQEAVRFVMQELRIPWPWVALTLIEDCRLDAHTDLTGETFPDRTFHFRQAVVVPALCLLPIPGESMEEQHERLAEAWRTSEAAGRAALAAVSQNERRGRGPKKKADRLQDYGRWVYETEYRSPTRSRHALGRELPVHLAHEHAAVCDCYKVISAGIREAHRLFALCAVTWDTLRSPARQPKRPRGK